MKPRLERSVPWHCGSTVFWPLLYCDAQIESRNLLVHARLMIREAQHHGSQGWLDYDGDFCQQAALDLSLQCNVLLRLPHFCLLPQMAVRVCLLIVAHFAQFAEKLTIQ